MSICYVPGIMLSSAYALSHVIFRTIFYGLPESLSSDSLAGKDTEREIKYFA